MQWKKNNEAIKDREIKDIRNLFEHEEGFFKPVKADDFWGNNYIECEGNGDWNETVSDEEYLNEIRPCLKDINDLKESDTFNW